MEAGYSKPSGVAAYPLWITIPYTLFVIVLVPFYWREYGPGNFLWFSDIALFAVLFALWTCNRLAYSMMAVGVLPLEVAWTADFLLGGNLIGLAAYMWDAEELLHMRLLSGFHLFLPPLMIWMLIRQGYDRRAFFAQTVFAWIVLVLSWLLTTPEENINWVHGLGPGPDAETILHPVLYLVLYMLLLPIGFLLTHLILKRLFRP
jgi:hypothetical protein